MIKHGFSTICRALSSANKLYMARDDEDCKVSIKKPTFMTAPLFAKAQPTPTKDDPNDKASSADKIPVKNFPVFGPIDKRSPPAKAIFDSSSDSSEPNSHLQPIDESAKDNTGADSESPSKGELLHPVVDKDPLQIPSPEKSSSSEPEIDIGFNTPIQLSSPKTPQYSPDFPLDLRVNREGTMSSNQSSAGDSPTTLGDPRQLKVGDPTTPQGITSQSETASTPSVSPQIPSTANEQNVGNITEEPVASVPCTVNEGSVQTTQDSASVRNAVRLKDFLFAGTSGAFKERYENDVNFRIRTLMAASNFFRSYSQNMDQTFFMKFENITEDPYVKVSTSQTPIFEGTSDHVVNKQGHSNVNSSNASLSKLGKNHPRQEEPASNVLNQHDLDSSAMETEIPGANADQSLPQSSESSVLLSSVSGGKVTSGSETESPIVEAGMKEIHENPGNIPNTSDSTANERRGEKRNPEDSPVGQNATKVPKVSGHVEDDQVPGPSTGEETTQRKAYTTKLTSRMKLKKSDRRFVDLYAKSLKLDNVNLPIEPNLLAASGVLLELIAARGIEMFGPNPDTPIQFVERVCGLATQDPPPDWNKLFHQTDKDAIKSEWAKVLGEDPPFNDKKVRDEILENLALAFTSTSRANKTHSSYYFRKLSFCIGLLVIGSFKAVGKECPIVFTPNDLAFWKYLGTPEAETVFNQASGWKIPATLENNVSPENQDEEWDLVTSWLKGKDNYRVFFVEEEIKRMTGSGPLSTFYQKSRKEEAVRKQAYQQAGKILPEDIKKDKDRLKKRQEQEKKRQQKKKSIKKKSIKKKKGPKEEEDSEFEDIGEVVEGNEGAGEGAQDNGGDKDETPKLRRSSRNKQ